MLRVVEFRNGTSWHWMKDYVFANGRHLGAVSAAEGVRHFYLDHLGSIRQLSLGAGHPAAFHTYFPFGEEAPPIAHGGEAMKLTGPSPALSASGSRTSYSVPVSR